MHRTVLPVLCAVFAGVAAVRCAFTPKPMSIAGRREGGPGLRVVRHAEEGTGQPAPVLSAKALEETMKDPEKMKMFQSQAQEMLKDPEKLEMLKKATEVMMQDPEQRSFMETMQSSMVGAIDELKKDPDMSDFFKAMDEEGPDAMKKFEKDEKVMEKINGVRAGLKEMMEKEQAALEFDEDLVKEIFDKFDEDKDGILNLEEFNCLQKATGGPETVYDMEQLEALCRNLDPELEDTSKGMPFKLYRALYLDPRLKKAYGTDVVGDHGKIFGSS